MSRIHPHGWIHSDNQNSTHNRWGSSVGESGGFITRRSGVQIPPPPLLTVARFRVRPFLFALMHFSEWLSDDCRQAVVLQNDITVNCGDLVCLAELTRPSSQPSGLSFTALLLKRRFDVEAAPSSHHTARYLIRVDHLNPHDDSSYRFAYSLSDCAVCLKEAVNSGTASRLSGSGNDLDYYSSLESVLSHSRFVTAVLGQPNAC
jgi:hypothetical protein